MPPLNSSSPSLHRKNYLSASEYNSFTGSNSLKPGNGPGQDAPTGAGTWIQNAGNVIDIYRGVRCAIKPTAPGCQPTQTDVYMEAPQKDYTWVIIGSVVALMLLVLIIVFALKK